MKSRTFIDEVTLYATAGNGGHGAASFRREKFIPRGGPDGGDGGRGGHVILRANRNKDSLVGIYYEPQRRAPHGGPGRGNSQHGRNGKDLFVDVPCGTVVRDAASGCILGDLIAEASELIVAHGGKGGLGNLHWKSSTNRAPREHTDGGQGEETVLRLELKLIADGGLVGYPNAGKSALTGKLTHAHPKVASYPFTTLNPIIGTIVLEDYERITIADIPGLIKGAHTGTGLGHAFLRHIERSLFLIYVVDMAGYEGRPPHEDYLNLREELRLHQEDLVRRPSIVVANKMDLPEAAEHLKVFKRKTRTRPIPVSALTGDGIDALRQAICDLKKKAAGQPSIASR